ncbi:MAG: ATP-dependent sacrificial sulfur transferase LarE [Kiritimatiellales bacterium]|nr:ATP-dependent sacrificial sulfur transferase LarE [Pontiella sp.]NNJ71130.1 ATP-dependent sacrificial sulfur transferase LarE [Kiritimatiellales bacterium]
MKTIDQKEQVLLDELKSYGSLAVAYSGGVDSSYLADCAHEALGQNALMVIADSPSIPREELQQAIDLANGRGWNLRVIQTSEHLNPDYLENKGDRCFHCKNELFTKMETILSEFDDVVLAHGAIEDDKGDIRPGTQAAANHCVVAPLQNAELFKKEIRILSERRGLPTAEKASFACLGSRFPTGTRIELEAMTQVEKAEAILRARGYTQYRVRHHENLCRIEIEEGDFEKIMTERLELTDAIKQLGYRFVTLDLCGYTMGSSA